MVGGGVGARINKKAPSGVPGSGTNRKALSHAIVLQRQMVNTYTYMCSSEKKIILLVEDDHITARVEKKALEAYHYQVVVAATGEEAVQLCTPPHSIDLVLMDIDLGAGIDGTEAARRILGLTDLPVVFLSSHTEPEVVEKTEKITSYGYVVKSSSNTVLDASIKMAFRLFDAKQEVKSREKTYRTMIANISDVIVIIDSEGISRYKSSNLTRWFGWKPAELVGQSAFYTVHPDDLPLAKNLLSNLKDTPGSVGTLELRYLCKDGSYTWIEITLANLLDNEVIQGFLGNYHQISQRKAAEESLRESEMRFKALHNASFGGIAIHENGVILDCNQGLSDMTGYSTEELIGMNGLLLITESTRNLVIENIRAGYEKPYEACGVRKNGQEYTLRLEARNIPYRGRQVRVVEFRDITEVTRERNMRTRSQEHISKLLAEKETLLREVHHRIKNNMNQIYGLLLLQATTIAEPEAVTALHNAAQRVQSMILLYDRIYQSSDFTNLPINEYLPPLIEQIIANFDISIDISLQTDIEDIMLSTTNIQSLGILLNELLTNSMKHAFVGRATGTISVSARQHDARVRIVVADDGIGMPEGNTCNTGFGMTLVHDMVKQLNGTIKADSHNGTRWSLDFPKMTDTSAC